MGHWSGLALCLTKVRSSRARCPATALIVGKFIISGLKPVHLSFLYLQNKKRLLQGVHVDFGSKWESCNGQA